MCMRECEEGDEEREECEGVMREGRSVHEGV